jgi:hypothetical protein
MLTREKYVSPETFHRFMNQIAGVKIGMNRVYQQLAEGKIRSLKTGIKGYQIPISELEGDYEDRLLLESKDLPTAHKGLLGNKVTTLNG